MRGQTLATIDAVIIALVAIFLAVQLDLTAAAGNHYLVLHPCLFPTHMRVVFSVTKELVKVRIVLIVLITIRILRGISGGKFNSIIENLFENFFEILVLENLVKK